MSALTCSLKWFHQEADFPSHLFFVRTKIVAEKEEQKYLFFPIFLKKESKAETTVNWEMKQLYCLDPGALTNCMSCLKTLANFTEATMMSVKQNNF